MLILILKEEKIKLYLYLKYRVVYHKFKSIY